MEFARRPSFGYSLVIFICSVALNSYSAQSADTERSVLNFSLFEKNGKVGLKTDQGDVIIPAEYDALGWSNGQFSVINKVTGYKSNQKWGLISIDNHRITKAEYSELIPAESSLLIARKTGYSPRQLAGCINTSGKEVIPFRYDGLSISSFRAIAYAKDGKVYKYGLIDLENKILVPLDYQHIYPLGSLRYAVENFNGKTAIFSENGKQISDFLIDSISVYKKDFAIIYQNHRQGLIDRDGQIKLDPIYGQLRINDDGSVSARLPDAWLLLNGENKLLAQHNADLLKPIAKNLYRVENADRIQLMNGEFKPLHELQLSFLGEFQKNKAIFKRGNKSGVIRSNGTIAIEPRYTGLEMDGSFVRTRMLVDHQERWTILDSLGNKLTSKLYDFIGQFNGKYFPVRNKNYWGAVDSKGKEVIACVHDSLIQHLNNHIVVKFRGQYGIIDLTEDWIITPRSNRLRLLSDTSFLELSPKTKFLKSLRGTVVYFTDNDIKTFDGYLLEYLPSGTIWKIDYRGVIIERQVRPEGQIDEIYPESEGLRAIKSDGRLGFVDSRGRLRIANRYENVKSYSEGLAAARIRGKWGFIDHEDKIAIQPAYEDVTPFKDGYSLVRQNNLFGLINKTGKQILPVRYDSIRITGNQINIVQNKLVGLANLQGNILIHPKYNALVDLNNGYVIVERDGKFGLLTRQGISTIPLIYDGLWHDAIHDQYVALRKSSWGVVSIR
ncbi:MAG: WG repeat-containing protein [Bacteroidota bacterium]